MLGLPQNTEMNKQLPKKAIYTKFQSIATFEKSNARIDYILVDKSLEIYKYKVDKINLSDHYPIIANIRLK